ncbi:hypothetical protein [Companilactobacillus baiquanensis]|uniref:Uncharacterized protein n=1 Tax=Companilactobacillus baiquanensis TaxID=2486005 RepID=A0ABW1UW41_9LACO|nr:hypothetical protein [Companilactobacillus baiquanensis]
MSETTLHISKDINLEEAKELILKPKLEKIILDANIAIEYLPTIYHIFRLNRITVLGNQKAKDISPNIFLDNDINNYEERAIFVEV